MNHHISHRENEIGFLHLRTLSIEVQVSFEHVFGSFIKFFEIIKIRFLRKNQKPFFRFSDPHFGQFITACQKLQFSLRAFSK